MERLTERTDLGSLIQKGTVSTRDMINRLGHYEDVVEKLEEVYGECDGLLEVAIDGLLKYGTQEGPEIKPVKATLLTDEDADEWERYKKLKTESRLLELPVAIDAEVWGIILRMDDFLGSYRTVTRMAFRLDMLDKIGKTVFLTKKQQKQNLLR